MNPYWYKVSLRLSHPWLDPAEITSALRREPSRSWRAGGPRTPPKGQPLEGHNKDTYWTAVVVEAKWPSVSLSEAIDELIVQLAPHRDFLRRVRTESGTAALFVGWFFDEMMGDTFDCDLLARLADLGLDLSLDLDPPQLSQALVWPLAETDAALDQFVGRRCATARIGLDRTLRLAFEASAGAADPRIRTLASMWRISINDRVVAGQYDCVDWERGLEAALAALSGRELRRAEFLSPGSCDLRLSFADAVAVDLLEASRDDHGLEADLPDGSCVEIGPGRTVRASRDEESTTGERAWASHAEHFWQRHAPRLPPPAVSGRCAQCAYFCMLNGGFHFWDVGVCSNGASEHDGRLVRVTSGCDAFSAHLRSR